MKKKVFGRQLSRSRKSRRALFTGLVAAIVENEKITTTQARAKSIVGDLDKAINLAKKGDSASLRNLYSSFGNNKKIVKKLTLLAPYFKERSSGYVRFVKIEKRSGDNAQMVRMEFVKDIVKEPKVKAKTKKVKAKK